MRTVADSFLRPSDRDCSLSLTFHADSPLGNSPESVRCALFPAQSLQVDSELLRLLIEMTALQSKGFRRHAHVVMATLQFGDNDSALERLHALCEGARSGGEPGSARCHALRNR